MRNPGEVAFAILSVHWVASAMRSAADEPASKLLHAIHDMTAVPSTFVLQGCASYERNLSVTIDRHTLLHFARGAYANTGNQTITPEITEFVDNFFWAWDAFLRELLKLKNPSSARIALAFEDVEYLPYLLLREGPDAVRARLADAPADRPELQAMIRNL